MHVLAASQVTSTWVVEPAGCGGDGTVANCTEERGGSYDWNDSSTWKAKNAYQLAGESSLGLSGNDINGTFGFDTLGLPVVQGDANVSVASQVVAYYSNPIFYVGFLGVNALATNFTPTESSPSLLTALKDQGSIPSRSFGFTAGASYSKWPLRTSVERVLTEDSPEQGGVNASLTLGGYDTSRFTPNDVGLTFGPDQTRQLLVNVQSITYTDSKITTPTPLLTDGINALVDSTVPYLWLPLSACQAFEKAFDLTWDPTRNLYTVNDTLHSSLLKTNPSVSFQLSNNPSDPAVNITLPYASFDLTATPPFGRNATRFFPLQRANDDTQYVLGRAFLQEAYIIVDYDRGNFSIFQSTFNSNTPSRIVPISAPQTTGTSSPAPSGVTVTQGNGSQSGGSHGISSGAIAGIVIAIVVIALGLVGGFWCFRRRKNKQSRQDHPELPGEAPPMEKPVDADDAKDGSIESEEGPDKSKYTAASPAPPYPTSPMSEMDADPVPAPLSSSKPSELPGEQLPRSTYTTPEPLPASELAAPGEIPMMRSQLSTPDPMYSSPELPAQDMRQEMPSPVPSSQSADSPKMSSSAIPTDNRPIHPSSLPQQPNSAQIDSPETNYGFTRDGMKRFATRRVDSNASESSRRPLNMRRDSKESGISQLSLSSMGSPILPIHQAPLPTGAGRPPMQSRVDSNDSATWENRLEVSSASSDSEIDAERSQHTATTTTNRTTSETVVRSNSTVAQGKRPEPRPQGPE